MSDANNATVSETKTTTVSTKNWKDHSITAAKYVGAGVGIAVAAYAALMVGGWALGKIRGTTAGQVVADVTDSAQ